MRHSFWLLPILVLATVAIAGCAASEEATSTSRNADPAAGEPAAAPAPRYPVVPRPRTLEARDGQFAFDTATRIVLSDPGDEQLRSSAQLFATVLRDGASLPMRVADRPADGPTDNAIALLVTGAEEAGAEAAGTEGAYRLDVTPQGVVVRAATAKGAFYGLQTLRQLLPADVERGLALNDRTWTVPAVHVEDAPRFSYRGMHLDVGRHFFSVSFVKRYIDLLALHKLDTFHWHLTEDQGWRIEIEQYPRLTEVGACRAASEVRTAADSASYDGTEYCGYYTQEEVREIVDYAQARHVTIIPEIEMPGHSTAALAAYPELTCSGDPLDVSTSWGIHENLYCPTEETFTFLENVLTEVMELFPSEYIHIGGDEAPKVQWEESEVAQSVIEQEGLAGEEELQTYFISRISTFLREHGRKLIGWEDILQGGLPPGATLMSWRSTDPGVDAARQGHDVIMAVNDAFYFNFCHQEPSNAPTCHRRGFYPDLELMYTYELVPEELSETEAEHVLGAQGNVWTEWINTPNKVEYMAFPYMLALAEQVWTPPARQSWPSFQRRVYGSLPRLEALEVNYHEPNFAPPAR